MIRHIPPQSTRRWTGPYLGNYYGTLWKTFNVDLDRSEGIVGLSQRMERIEDSTELPDLSGNQIRVFTRSDADCEDRFWAANEVTLFKTDSSAQPSPADDWDTDALANSPSAGISDMSIHGNDSRNDSGRNKLFVTTDSDIYVLNDTGNNTWTANWWVTKQSQRGLDTAVPHPIQYFPNRKISLVGDGNLVHTISRPSDTQNDTISYARLVLPRDYIANHIFTTTDRAWICCYHKRSGEGAVVEWDGFSQSANQFHRAYGMAALTGVNYGERPIILNSQGVFLEYTGQGFVPMERNGHKVALPIASEPSNSIVDNSTPGTVSFRVYGRSMVAGENNLIYLNIALPLFNSFQQKSGIWCLNPQTGRLYRKHSIGVWGSGTDYGQQTSETGGLYWSPSATSSRNLLAGGILGTLSTSGIWLLEDIFSTTATRGYFISQFIPADEVREFWDSLWIRFRRFRASGRTIVVKAKGVKSLTEVDGDPLERTITWTSTSTFTVTLVGTSDALAVGDEVEILSGQNAGYLAHITDISGAHGALQTITIDETVSTGSLTSIALFDRWKKLGTITDTTLYEANLPIGIDSSFIQFKVEMRGPAREIEVSDLIVNSKTSIYDQK